MASWRERWVKELSELKFQAPASVAAVEAISQAFGPNVPADLLSLLQESDGVLGPYSLDLVWSAERILRDNQMFRSDPGFKDLYMSFDSALFFGDAGNGDQFFYPVLASGGMRTDVYVWNHEDDSRTWAAHSLENYVRWYLDGTLKV